MGRKATTIEEQMKILESRGMKLDLPYDKVREILLDIGYYRLGFYWNPFEVDALHTFRDNTLFSDAVSLYYLDCDLRKLITIYLNRIEINFRTKLVYHISNQYPNSSTWFIDPNVVNNKYIAEFDSKVYTNSFIENNKPIKNHHRNYLNDRYAPAWKTIEFFTFGSTYYLFKSLIHAHDKKLVAQCYDIRDINIFERMLYALVHTRNQCAHGSAVFDMNLPLSLRRMPFMNITHNLNNLDAVLKVITYFLSKISTNRELEFKNELDSLHTQHKYNQTIRSIVRQKMGTDYYFTTQ